MPVTHCLPNGSLGASEIPVSNVSIGSCTMYLPSGGAGLGNIRGVVVYMHGFPIVNMAIPATIPADGTSPVGALGYYKTFQTNVNLDGWAVLAASYPEDFAAIGSTAVFNDITNDSGNGSRYVTERLLWWDHVVDYIHKSFGPWPIVPFGQSWGAYHSMLIAANKASTILGYMAAVPATSWQNSSPAFTGPTSLYNIPGNVAQLSSTALNATTLPGIISYGTKDEAAGFGGTTTVAAGFVTAAASVVTTLPLTSTADLFNGAGGPLVSVITSGGSGLAIFSYTSISAGSLLGVTLLNGSGNVVAGAAVTQSLTKAIIANQQAAQPSNQVTANVTADLHEFTNQDASAATFPVLGAPATLASLSGTNLTIITTVNNTSSLVSGACAVWGSDNVWHTLNFTSQPSNTQLNGVTFGGSSSATISSTSPITQTDYTVGAGLPYWLNQTLSPLAPRTF